MKFKLCLFFIILLGIISCSTKKNDFNQIQATTITALAPHNFKKIYLKKKLGIAAAQTIENVNNKYLIVVCDRKKGVFNVYKLPAVHYLYGWGHHGKGPNGFTALKYPRTINTYKDHFIIYNAMSRRLRNYIVTDSSFILDKNELLSIEKQTASLEPLKRINESEYVAFSGPTAPKEFMVVSPNKDHPLFSFSNYPPSDLKGLARYNKFSEKGMAVQPNGSKFVVIYGNLNIIKIFHLNHNHANLIHRIKIMDPHYNGPIHRFEMRATENYIFTLAYYASKKEMKNNVKDLQPIIEIWNWNGKQLYRIKLNKSIERFAVSEKYQKIYGISIFNPHVIYVFDFSSFL